MMSVWLYRFKPGMTASTLEKLRARGAENLYPGCAPTGGTLLGRCWGHPTFTHGSVFRRRGIAAVRAEAEDADNLLRNLRILSPNVGAFQVCNFVPVNDPELVSLGDDEWHAQVVAPWIDAAKANPEVAYHLNVIGMSCLKYNTAPPYMVQAVWRDKFGFPTRWLGGSNPRDAAASETGGATEQHANA